MASTAQIYDSLDSMSLTVKVTPTDAGTFDAVIQEVDPVKTSKLGAIAQYMALTDKTTFPGTPITAGGSSKGGKSKKARRTKGGKSKKARKGKSLRRK
jgi:hypothetical protein